MHAQKFRRVQCLKLLLAAVLLVALVSLPAKELAPGVPFGELLLYCAGGVAGVVALLILGAVCSLQLAQFILRSGGTDTQWFWFSSEPKGLALLRPSKTGAEKGRNEF